MKSNKFHSIGITSSQVTPKDQYLSRRNFIKQGIFAGVGLNALTANPALAQNWFGKKTTGKPASVIHADEWLKQKTKSATFKQIDGQTNINQYDLITSYNNFYEFGFDKSDPKNEGWDYKPDNPWEISIEGEVEKKQTISLESLLKNKNLQERIYRLRCVEAWSMVIPWIGIPLKDVLKDLNVLSSANYVGFETVVDRKQMPGVKSFFSTIDWPYREGLRIDEAMNDLTFLAVGLYGEPLPGPNGAPIRLVVPWKYGFKSIKSIKSIKLLKRQPKTTWSQLAPKEYGFFANVNPNVSHPRWSQARERKLPSSFVSPNWQATKMFNGYGDFVADMYKNHNFAKNY